jgi:hypothetical protein
MSLVIAKSGPIRSARDHVDELIEALDGSFGEVA